MRLRMIALLATSLVFAGASMAQTTYLWDDGTAENAIGLTAGGNVVAINHFNVSGSNNKITGVLVSWGALPFPGGSGVSNGTPFRYFVWGDPNLDGNPSDMGSALLFSGVGAVAGSAIDTNAFQTAPVPSVTVPSSFFVGVAVDHTAGTFPLSLDQTDPDNGHSWVAGHTTPGAWDPTNPAGGIGLFNLNNIGLPGDWLLRATAVPEPGSMIALGLGAALLLRRRKRA